MVEVLNINNRPMADLINVSNVCMTTPLNSLATASFELPYNDPQIKDCTMRRFIMTAAAGGGSVQATTTQPAQTSSAGGKTYGSTMAGGGGTSGGGGGANKSTDSSPATAKSTDSSSKTSTDGAAGSAQVELVTGLATLNYDLTGSHSHRHTLRDVEMAIDYAINNHTHGMNHYHNFTTPAHAHNFYIQDHSHSIGDHSHQVNIEAHTHDTPSHDHMVNIPTHVHAAVYGIYEGGRATSATVTIDGRVVSVPINQDYDITNLLSVDGGGRIKRGATQNVRIIPNALTRINATATVGLFSGSAAGKAA